MTFRNYAEAMDRLDSIGTLINQVTYLPESERKRLIQRIDRLRAEYEIALVKEGDYPTI